MDALWRIAGCDGQSAGCHGQALKRGHALSVTVAMAKRGHAPLRRAGYPDGDARAPCASLGMAPTVGPAAVPSAVATPRVGRAAALRRARKIFKFLTMGLICLIFEVYYLIGRTRTRVNRVKSHGRHARLRRFPPAPTDVRPIFCARFHNPVHHAAFKTRRHCTSFCRSSHPRGTADLQPRSSVLLT